MDRLLYRGIVEYLYENPQKAKQYMDSAVKTMEMKFSEAKREIVKLISNKKKDLQAIQTKVHNASLSYAESLGDDLKDESQSNNTDNNPSSSQQDLFPEATQSTDPSKEKNSHEDAKEDQNYNQ